MQGLAHRRPGTLAYPDQQRALYKKMTKYVQNTIKRSTEAILNMVDYRLNNDIGAGGRGLYG